MAVRSFGDFESWSLSGLGPCCSPPAGGGRADGWTRSRLSPAAAACTMWVWVEYWSGMRAKEIGLAFWFWLSTLIQIPDSEG